MIKDITIEDAFNRLKMALKEDLNYAWSWHCNIAMAAYDEGLSHINANKAAARFMLNCFDIDMTKNSNYIDIINK